MKGQSCLTQQCSQNVQRFPFQTNYKVKAMVRNSVCKKQPDDLILSSSGNLETFCRMMRDPKMDEIGENGGGQVFASI